MSKEKQIDEMDLAALSCYRNKYYADGLATEQGIIANAINEVLPILVSVKNGGYSKQKVGRWVHNEDRSAYEAEYFCSECLVDGNNDGDEPFCWNCGAKMKGGAE